MSSQPTNPTRQTPEFKPTILVTGCGSGLGLALADLLYGCYEYRVVATARQGSQEFLKQRFLENDRFWILPLDVTIEADRTNLIAQIEARWGGVDILINNAGISYRAVVEHMTDQDEWQQMDTNYLGPMALVRAVLPFMRKQGRGKIINISSVSGMLAMPTMASYSASKYALEGASEALWYEAKPLGINICLVQPGFIRSQSFLRVYSTNKADLSREQKTAYHDYYENMIPFVGRLMGASKATPQDVARKVLTVIQTENPPLWVAGTSDALLFYYLRRFIPRRWLLPILFHALPGSRQWGATYAKRRMSRPVYLFWSAIGKVTRWFSGGPRL